MTLKLEIEQWQKACVAFDEGNYDISVKHFIGISDSARIHFNIGLIFTAVDDHKSALEAYTQAIAMDPYLAVAYFQRGVSNFIVNRLEAARNDFDQAYCKLRGNQLINYEQLGLQFKLYLCEIIYNRGICQIHMGKMDAGLTDLYQAQKAKVTKEHEIIDKAVKHQGKDYSIFSIPPQVIFRPPENRLKQLKNADILNELNDHPAQKSNKKNNCYNYDYQHISRTKNQDEKPLKRNNSALINDMCRTKNQNVFPQSPPSPLSKSPSISTQFGNTRNLNSSRQISPLSPSSPYPSSYNQLSPTFRKRNDSNLGLYQSDDASSIVSYNSSGYQSRQDGNRVDSGFESALEDRYSSASSVGGANGHNIKNLSKNHYDQRFSPPPIPSASKQSEFDDSTTYGDFDQELEEVYGSMRQLSVHSKDYNYGQSSIPKEGFYIQPSVSTSTVGSNQSSSKIGRIKIKVHYTDTRILLVSNTITFQQLKSKIVEKFNATSNIRLQYKDEDNEMVLMIDDDDLFMARQSSGSPHDFEKLEIWCV